MPLLPSASASAQEIGGQIQVKQSSVLQHFYPHNHTFVFECVLVMEGQLVFFPSTRTLVLQIVLQAHCRLVLATQNVFIMHCDVL